MTSSGPIPPIIPTSFQTQNGTATPAANILIVNGFDSTENNDNGIITKGGVVGTGTINEVDVVITNRQTGTVTTADATLTTIITFPMGATAGAFYVYGNVQAFNSTTPAAGTYSFSGGFRTDGVTGTELGTELHDEFEDPALVSSDVFLTASGNNIILSVQGVGGLSLNWNALMEYRRVI
jgi:hypothetical protein